MERWLETAFDQVFSGTDTISLAVRYRRRCLEEHINGMIVEFIQGRGFDPQTACKSVISAAVRYHEKNRIMNKNICRMGKYHNILYIAAKVCYDWKLNDSAVVAYVMNNIFWCEGTFERLFLGAIFGTTAPYFITGWKSDFNNKDQNISALPYFFDHAMNAKLNYKINDFTFARYIDVPMESCGNKSALRVILQIRIPELLYLFLKYGAVFPKGGRTNDIDQLIENIYAYKDIYPYNLVTCLKLIMRTVDRIRLLADNEEYIPGENLERRYFTTKYSDLVKDNVVPESRCGIVPPELKHLARCAVRQRLWENYCLPKGIFLLDIPTSLQHYLNLLED